MSGRSRQRDSRQQNDRQIEQEDERPLSSQVSMSELTRDLVVVEAGGGAHVLQLGRLLVPSRVRVRTADVGRLVTLSEELRQVVAEGAAEGLGVED